MKRVCFVLFLASLCFCGLISCSDDDEKWSAFNGVPVTVSGNNLLGYKLYTDFDAILVPTNLSQISALNDVQRAIISFDLADGNNEKLLEAGRTYEIVINTKGESRPIPTFTVCIDTLSMEYQSQGQDSIAIKNKKVYSFEKGKTQFYVKNGYMNLTSTFDYSPYSPVYFSLFYDSDKDVDIVNKKVFLNLYFNNNVEIPYGTVSSLLNFKMSEDIFEAFYMENILMNDSLDIYLKAYTQQSGNEEELHCKVALKDFLTPDSY